MAEEFGEVLTEGLVPGGGHNTHCGHDDHVEEDVQDDTECGTLPELDLGPVLGDHAVEDREGNREGEVDDEAHVGQVVAQVGVGCVGGFGGHAENLLQQRLRRVGGVTFGGAGREGNFPTELDDARENTSDQTDEDCDTDAAACRVGDGLEGDLDLLTRLLGGGYCVLRHATPELRVGVWCLNPTVIPTLFPAFSNINPLKAKITFIFINH